MSPKQLPDLTMLKFNTEAQRTQSFRSGDCFSAISVPLCLEILMTKQEVILETFLSRKRRQQRRIIRRCCRRFTANELERFSLGFRLAVHIPKTNSGNFQGVKACGQSISTSRSGRGHESVFMHRTRNLVHYGIFFLTDRLTAVTTPDPRIESECR